MRTFDVQSIELDVPFADAFRYLADPTTLPEWTHAFRAVDDRRATMATPGGTVQVGPRWCSRGSRRTPTRFGSGASGRAPSASDGPAIERVNGGCARYARLSGLSFLCW